MSKKNANVTNAIPKGIYELSFIQIGQLENVQNLGENFGKKGEVGNQGGGGISRKKLQTSHKKMNLYSKFHQN